MDPSIASPLLSRHLELSHTASLASGACILFPLCSHLFRSPLASPSKLYWQPNVPSQAPDPRAKADPSIASTLLFQPLEPSCTASIASDTRTTLPPLQSIPLHPSIPHSHPLPSLRNTRQSLRPRNLSRTPPSFTTIPLRTPPLHPTSPLYTATPLIDPRKPTLPPFPSSNLCFPTSFPAPQYLPTPTPFPFPNPTVHTALSVTPSLFSQLNPLIPALNPPKSPHNNPPLTSYPNSPLQPLHSNSISPLNSILNLPITHPTSQFSLSLPLNPPIIANPNLTSFSHISPLPQAYNTPHWLSQLYFTFPHLNSHPKPSIPLLSHSIVPTAHPTIHSLPAHPSNHPPTALPIPNLPHTTCLLPHLPPDHKSHTSFLPHHLLSLLPSQHFTPTQLESSTHPRPPGIPSPPLLATPPLLTSSLYLPPVLPSFAPLHSFLPSFLHPHPSILLSIQILHLHYLLPIAHPPLLPPSTTSSQAFSPPWDLLLLPIQVFNCTTLPCFASSILSD